MFKRLSIVITILVSFASISANAATINPLEDVMTSGFFQGSNTVRGYTGDGRNAHRVSTNSAFGFPVAKESVYIIFDGNDFASLMGPVSATLSLQSTAGGFNGDASSGNPFTVSAHALNADPLTSITDDTNPAGPIAWEDFFDNNILAADTSSYTSVDSFGNINFDVSNIVNDWILDSNSIFAIALTGKNDTSGNEFLHGFLNNTENPDSTFLTVTAVPIPAAAWLFGSALISLVGWNRKSVSNN